MSMNYNLQELGTPYKQFRLCISDPLLLEACEAVQSQTAMSERELIREALLSYLEEENQIKVS